MRLDSFGPGTFAIDFRPMNPAGRQILAELLDCDAMLLADDSELAAVFEQAIAQAGLQSIGITAHRFSPSGSTIVAILTESHAVLHTYPEAGHVSVDIFTCSGDSQKPARLLEQLRLKLKPEHVQFANIQRGRALSVDRPQTLRLSSTDGLEISLQIEERVYAGRSDFQQIEVVDTRQFGRLLVLDGQVQLCAQDQDLYIDALLGGIKAQTSAVVLGGGDGTVAAALCKRGFQLVQSVDIDPQVTTVVREHFPELVRSSDPPAHASMVSAEVIDFLQTCERTDTIVCDLTMHPEAFTRVSRELYLANLFELAAARLTPGTGTFALQVASAFDRETIAIVTRLLKAHFTGVALTKRFIPSLCREWIFASAVKPQ